MFRVYRAAAAAVGAAFVAAITLVGPSTARACSICRCGDATFAALGGDVFAGPHLSFALDYERFEKQSVHNEPLAGVTHTTSLAEDRLTLAAFYGRGGRWSALARVPFSARRLEVREFLISKPTAAHQHLTPGQYDANALSDPEFSLFFRAWTSRFEPRFGRRTSLTLQGGTKLPLGRNDLQLQGVRLSEHLQAGTGSSDLFAGLSALHLVDERSTLFLSASVRANGANGAGYHYGSAALANAAYEHKLPGRFDGVLELNYRYARQDRLAPGAFDADTGGQVLYVTPRLLAGVGAGWVARLAAQIPVATRLQGSQTEHAVLNAGLTYVR